MTELNAVGWFDIYVSDMDRAATFYENVLKQQLEEIVDPTGVTQIIFETNDNRSDEERHITHLLCGCTNRISHRFTLNCQ